MLDKTKLKDSSGRPLTQGLFLETEYNYERAVYTLKDEDHKVNGITYPSLKRLYLEEEDPTEYSFATTHLLGWSQWTRMCENKTLRKHIDEWREELELKLRSRAIADIIDMSAQEKGFQAAKWLADKGWDKRGAGRPTKDRTEHEKRMEDRLNDEYGDDFKRLRAVK